MVAAVLTSRRTFVSLVAAGIATLQIVTAAPASAWSGTHSTGTLPGTRDYIQTNTWMGTDYAGSPTDGWFNYQSSSYLYGNYPYSGYFIEDSNNLQVNGIGVSISNTGVGAQSAPNKVTYTSHVDNWWFAGNVGYNEHWEAFAFWDLVSNDVTSVQPWRTGSVFHNTAAATKWW
jgi:hypothetical protein